MDKPYWLLQGYDLLAYDSGHGFYWCDWKKNGGITIRDCDKSKLLSKKYLSDYPHGWVNLSEEEAILMCLRGGIST